MQFSRRPPQWMPVETGVSCAVNELLILLESAIPVDSAGIGGLPDM